MTVENLEFWSKPTVIKSSIWSNLTSTRHIMATSFFSCFRENVNAAVERQIKRGGPVFSVVLVEDTQTFVGGLEVWSNCLNEVGHSPQSWKTQILVQLVLAVLAHCRPFKDPR